MAPNRADKALDIDRLTTVIEDFNTVFIRLASVHRLNFSTLSVLHSLSRGAPMRLTDLLATEQIKQPALTNLVSKLESAGWIAKRPDPSDGRASLLSLTKAGEMVVQSRRSERVAKLTQLINGVQSERPQCDCQQCWLHWTEDAVRRRSACSPATRRSMKALRSSRCAQTAVRR